METRKLGVISDTHNLLRPGVTERMAGCDLIIHGGDIGAWTILEELELVAPVIAVRGNIDRAEWTSRLPMTRTFEIAGGKGLVVHNPGTLPPEIDFSEYRIVISGHSHRPLLEERDGTIFLNPGSAGPRRFSLPVTIAFLSVEGTTIRPEIVHLPVS